MSVKIERIIQIEPKHIEAANRIEAACFNEDEAFAPEDMLSYWEKSSVKLLALDDETKEAVGYALARDAFGIGYLYSNAVLSDFRGYGIGSYLLETRIQILKDRCARLVYAHTRIDNIESAYLLKKFGFISIRYEPDFYNDNIDAIYWELFLGGH